VRTLGWLMGMVEEIYAEVEARHRRQEDALLPLGGCSMPEVAFAHFHQKFGSKAIVDEYIGSLNNTLLQFEKVSPPSPPHTHTPTPPALNPSLVTLAIAMAWSRLDSPVPPPQNTAAAATTTTFCHNYHVVEMSL